MIDSFNGLNTPNNNDYNKNLVAEKGMFNIKGKDTYIKNFKECNIRLPDEIHEMWITKETDEHYKKWVHQNGGIFKGENYA